MIIKKKYIFLFYIALLFCHHSLFAQKYNFKNIGARQGVSSLEITDIIQDDKGFIWFTTLNGVAKYDGRTVEMIKKQNGLSGNFTRNLFVDSKQRLWVSTYGQGINYFKNDSLYSFSSDSLFKWIGAGIFTEDNKGNIWLVGNQDIVYFDGQKFIDYDSVHTISSIVDVVFRKDTLWIATTNKGIYAYDIKTKTYKNFNTDNGLKNNICYSLFIDSEEQFWVGCYGGLSLIKNDTILSFDLSEDFNKNRVKKIFEDKNGYLWLALYGNGVAKWDKTNFKVEKIFNSKNGLSHPYITSVLIDDDDNIWLTSDGEGVFLLNDFSMQIYDTDYGFSTNKINDINIKNDHIQILTLDGGEILFYKDTLINHLIKFHNDEIVAINTAVELNDTTWYGTSSGLRFKLANSTDFQVAENISPISDNTFHSIIRKNRPFFTGIQSYYSVKGKSLILYPPFDKQKKFSPIRLCLDKNENLWAYSLKKISFLNPNDGKVHLFKPSIKAKHFYGGCCSYKDKMYFVGEDYFEIISFEDHDTVFAQSDVLRYTGVNMALSILIDNDTVYIAHNKGLTIFNLNDINNPNLKYKTLTTNDGLPDEGIAEIKKGKNGEFWLTSFEGLIKYNSNLKKDNIKPPKVYLKSIELFSEKIDKEKLKYLEYNQNYLTFKWSSIAFNNIDDIEFSYQLIGFDENWSEPTKDLKTTYKKIPPGNYQFKLKVRYLNNKWSDEKVMATFYVDAPFYQKWWFILLVAIIIIAIVINLIYSVIITKKQKNTLQKFSKELIKSQEKERSKISKDLHDSVGQLLLFVRNKLKSSTKDDNLVNELDLALNEVRSISRQLHPYQLEKFGLTKAIEMLVEKASNNSNVFFSDELDNIDQLFSKDIELSVYRIIQESINNIIKHSKAKSAKIAIEKQNKQVKLLIQDNGKGFNAKEILSGKKHTFGLIGIVERVKIIGGGISIESSEKGTLLKIYIPL
jgi:signal transduction histidine kinase/ligand-binding sensor domain-containing protein